MKKSFLIILLSLIFTNVFSQSKPLLNVGNDVILSDDGNFISVRESNIFSYDKMGTLRTVIQDGYSFYDIKALNDQYILIGTSRFDRVLSTISGKNILSREHKKYEKYAIHDNILLQWNLNNTNISAFKLPDNKPLYSIKAEKNASIHFFGEGKMLLMGEKGIALRDVKTGDLIWNKPYKMSIFSSNTVLNFLDYKDYFIIELSPKNYSEGIEYNDRVRLLKVDISSGEQEPMKNDILIEGNNLVKITNTGVKNLISLNKKITKLKRLNFADGMRIFGVDTEDQLFIVDENGGNLFQTKKYHNILKSSYTLDDKRKTFFNGKFGYGISIWDDGGYETHYNHSFSFYLPHKSSAELTIIEPKQPVKKMMTTRNLLFVDGDVYIINYNETITNNDSHKLSKNNTGINNISDQINNFNKPLTAEELMGKDCLSNYSLFEEFYKQGEYEDAYPYILKASASCKGKFKNIFINGVKVYDYLLKKAKVENNESLKQKYLTEVLQLLKEREEYFGNDPIIQQQMESIKKTYQGSTEVNLLELPEEPEIDENVYEIVESMPEFPGGQEGLRQFLSQNIKYPTAAREANIQGKVYMEFIIDQNGKVTNAKIIRSVDPFLDQEALRVINSMPNWKPGKQRGKAVKVSYRYPINFALN